MIFTKFIYLLSCKKFQTFQIFHQYINLIYISLWDKSKWWFSKIFSKINLQIIFQSVKTVSKNPQIKTINFFISGQILKPLKDIEIQLDSFTFLTRHQCVLLFQLVAVSQNGSNEIKGTGRNTRRGRLCKSSANLRLAAPTDASWTSVTVHESPWRQI